MKPSNFVHLHVHTSFSLLDSSLRQDALFRRAAEFKMPAVAMTDHGNMFGAVELLYQLRILFKETYSISRASATAGCVMWPLNTFNPFARAGFS